MASLADADLAGRAREVGGSVLVLGGGTSELSANMVQDGWPNVLDVDFSPCVVEQRQQDSRPGGPRFALADARHMRPRDLVEGRVDGGLVGGEPAASSNPSGAAPALFDVCLDKGLVDALWCSGEDSASQITLVARSVAACLKPGGKFLVLSYSAPAKLQPLAVGPAGSALAALWAAPLEARKLNSLFLYVLERSTKRFTEEPPSKLGREPPPVSTAQQQGLLKHRKNRKNRHPVPVE
jgi:SAM-dependent methyltransferase